MTITRLWLALATALALPAYAQDRITRPIDTRVTVKLPGNRHPLARRSSTTAAWSQASPWIA